MKKLYAGCYLLFGLIWALVFSGCAAYKRTMPAFPRPVPALDEAQAASLSRAVESFYGARRMDDVTRALESARKIAPMAPVTQELEARIAEIQGREKDAWQHYYMALSASENEEAVFHMMDILLLPMTAEQFYETKELLNDIIRSHPNHNLRRMAAAFVASFERRLDGDVSKAENTLKKRGNLTSFAIINSFNNEEGQGFSVEYPPEREINFSREYKGSELPARWRMNVPLDHQNSISFTDLVSPVKNVVAYAVTYVYVPKEGIYSLGVTSTDPLKIWVNDIMMLEEQQIDRDAVDQFKIPFTLRKGWNSILAKTCHESGRWSLGLSLSHPDGRLIKGLKNSFGPKTVADGPSPGKIVRVSSQIDREIAVIEEPLRRKFYGIKSAKWVGVPFEAQERADAFRTAAKMSFFARLESALVSWNAGEKGVTIDILEELIAQDGPRAPVLYTLRSQYFSEQQREKRARDDLLSALKINPEYRSARVALAESYLQEGWAEDHLTARLRDVETWPDDTKSLWGLAAAYTKLDRQNEAKEIYERILSYWKGASDILAKEAELALEENNCRDAISYQTRLIELFPNAISSYRRLGDIYRRCEKFDLAEKTYKKCLAIDDRFSKPYSLLAELAYERGEKEKAVELWRKSLQLNPDNHALADRLEYIAPENDTRFAEYVPSASAIKQILSQRDNVVPHAGANLIFHLDHAVEHVGKDGSSRQVVTQVVTATNDTGRDKLTKYAFPPGRLRVMEAYAIDGNGKRLEASSMRQGLVRFRELKVGSTVVIQFRLDTYPGGFLARYLSRRWFFHGVGSQFEDSNYILILPKDMITKEYGQGNWNRKEITDGDERILHYGAKKVPPMVPEPFAPNYLDLLDQVVISSIPDWDTIAGWDAALLVNAFRTTPEIKSLAEKLSEGAKTKKEQLEAIARFVMKEIRYQQDYENTIAGVKPHAAPVVLERAYGDCKDKSVLLMTLARELGIETHFAILRTTSAGRFIKELPLLQFNHAIVYVPKQKDINTPFFIDATPDTLDLKTLRPDTQNTWAMVINPENDNWQFIHIPQDDAEQQYTIRRTKISTQLEDKSDIEVDLTFQGPQAASLRPVLRNTDDTRVFIAQLGNSLFPNSKVRDFSIQGADDIIEPVTLSMQLASSAVIRKQGKKLVVELPKSESLSKYIALEERRLPLQTNLFLSLVETEDEVDLPVGYTTEHVPDNLRLDTPFFLFERTVEVENEKVRLKLRFVEKKPLVTQKEYKDFRGYVKQIVENLGQDLVLKPQGGKGGIHKKRKS